MTEPASDFDVRFDNILKAAFDDQPIPAPDVDLVASGLLDSFDLLQLFMAMEDEFDRFWPVERMTAFRELSTIGRLRTAAQTELWAL
jgi:acyl carrier protein